MIDAAKNLLVIKRLFCLKIGVNERMIPRS